MKEVSEVWVLLEARLWPSLAWRLVLCFLPEFSVSTYDLETAFRWLSDECAFGNNLVLTYEMCFTEHVPCVYPTLLLPSLESSRISSAQ